MARLKEFERKGSMVFGRRQLFLVGGGGGGRDFQMMLDRVHVFVELFL